MRWTKPRYPGAVATYLLPRAKSGVHSAGLALPTDRISAGLAFVGFHQHIEGMERGANCGGGVFPLLNQQDKKISGG